MSCDSTLKVEVAVADEVLSEVAYLRAHGQSWEDAARAVEWDAVKLRRTLRASARYQAAYEAAARESEREAEAELLQRLRAQMNDPDPVLARRAAENLLRFLSARRRDQARLEIERLRGETRAAKAKARGEEKPEHTPEPSNTSNTERGSASSVAGVLAAEVTRITPAIRDREGAGRPPLAKASGRVAPEG